MLAAVHGIEHLPCQAASSKATQYCAGSCRGNSHIDGRPCLQDAKKRLEQQAREQAEKLRQEKLRQQQAKNKGRGRL
jgi:hypothetical protein